MYSCMVKGACIKRMVAVINYSTDTIMAKKNKQRVNGVGGRLRIWDFHG